MGWLGSAHAPLADEGGDIVVGDAGADGQGHGRDDGSIMLTSSGLLRTAKAVERLRFRVEYFDHGIEFRDL